MQQRHTLTELSGSCARYMANPSSVHLAPAPQLPHAATMARHTTPVTAWPSQEVQQPTRSRIASAASNAFRTSAAASASAATRRRDSSPSASHWLNTAGKEPPGLLGSSAASVAAATLPSMPGVSAAAAGLEHLPRSNDKGIGCATIPWEASPGTSTTTECMEMDALTARTAP